MAKKKITTHYERCPLCDSFWSSEELTQQQCETCGYPDITKDDFINPEIEDDDEPF